VKNVFTNLSASSSFNCPLSSSMASYDTHITLTSPGKIFYPASTCAVAIVPPHFSKNLLVIQSVPKKMLHNVDGLSRS
jgi:hypothetical protein